MNAESQETVRYLADIVDPTSDGIFLTLVNVGLGVLAVIVPLLGGWYAFKTWTEAKGKAAAMTGIREVGFGVLVLEGFLGAIALAANYGSNILGIFGISL